MTHADRQHAKYSASSSDRWLNCTGSVGLIQQIKKGPPNKYADRGTALHMVAEYMLMEDKLWREGDVVTIRPGITYELTEEDLEGVYVYVGEVLEEAINCDLLLIEEELNLSSIHPLVGGNVDAAVVKGNRLRVFDFKSGRGAVVYPQDNPQELQYGVGTYLTLPTNIRQRIDEVVLTIVQPFNSATQPVNDWITSPLRLVEHIAAIQIAVEEAERGGKLVVGEWCEWCPAASQCPALHKLNAELMDVMQQPPVQLSAARIGELLWKWHQLKSMMESLYEQAQKLAESGVHIPGFKLVPKRARYAWSDEILAEMAMRGAGMNDEQIWKRRLASPAQSKKAVGKATYDTELLPLVDNTSVGYNLVLDDTFGAAKGPDMAPELPSLADLLPSK